MTICAPREANHPVVKSPVALRKLSDDPRGTLIPLTPRELEVLVAYGRAGKMANAALDLGISLQTVKNHLTAAYRKLDASGSLDAYHRLGWLRLPGDPEIAEYALLYQSAAAWEQMLAASLAARQFVKDVTALRGCP